MRKLEAIAVIGRGRDFDISEPLTPCGSCRQMVYEASELSDFDSTVLMSNTASDQIYISTLQELFPLPFGPNALRKNIYRFGSKD